MSSYILSQDVKEPMTHVFSNMHKVRAVESGIFRIHGRRRDMFDKPPAVWISLNNDWERWCTSEEFIDIKQSYVADVELKPNLKLIKVTNQAEADYLASLMGFVDQYKTYDFDGRKFEYHMTPADSTQIIDYLLDNRFDDRTKSPWDPILEKFDGVYFLNRGDLHFNTFFNSWDVDSIALFKPYPNMTIKNVRKGDSLNSEIFSNQV